jgi:hypothetical protein
MPAARVFLLVVAAAAGVLTTVLFGGTDEQTSSGYLTAVLILLVIGLYGSTSGIDLTELRANLRIVVLAVTVGVLLKVALIAAVMLWIFDDPEYAVLGIAVAQIDPLSVAALRQDSRMSKSAKSILSAWASFDDPVTVLLTIYISGYVLSNPVGGTGIDSFLSSLALNAALTVAALLLWVLFSPARRGKLVRRQEPAKPASTQVSVVKAILAVGFMAAGAWLAVDLSLMLGVALIGLFLRPPERFMPAVDFAVRAALVAATFALGLVLAHGVNLGPGVVLGVLAFAAQIVVGFLLTVRQPRHDRVALAFSQQNGLTAIVLALVLEPALPGAVATIAPAIVTVAVLYGLTNFRQLRRTARTTDRSQSRTARLTALTAAFLTRTLRRSKVFSSSSSRSDSGVPVPSPAWSKGSRSRTGKNSATRS